MKQLKLSAYALRENTDMELPALIARIPAGEPLELSDEVELIDLNYLLTKGSANSIALRVEGNSMLEEIADGDWVIVSRDLQPSIGDIVVASLNGSYTLKRLKANDLRGRRGLYLVPSNGAFKAREMTEADNLTILGTVVHIIHSTR